MNKTDSLQIRWQRYLEKSFNILFPVLAIIGAFGVSSIIIIAWGSNPIEAYAALLSGAFGSMASWATTLTRLTPLIFTGLAVTYGYRSGFFNIGAEGQLFIGAYAAVWIGITFSDWPGWLLIIAAMLFAALSGSLLALIPGVLKARRGINEVLTTLLINYLIIQYFEWSLRVDHVTKGFDAPWTFINWLGLKDPTQPYPKSALIPESSWLPSVSSVLNGQGLVAIFGGSEWYQTLISNPALTRITLAPLLGIVAIVIIYYLLFHTTTGYRARAVGVNPEAARYMGINVGRTIITTALISGALAGLAGAMEILGSQHRVIPNFLLNAGFEGIPVAMIGQLNPFGVGLSALFFGALRAGANRMQIISGVPVYLVFVIQALAILFAIAGTTIDISARMRQLSSKFAKKTAPQPSSEIEVPHA
jgi:general nucleoside transport system permease protein